MGRTLRTTRELVRDEIEFLRKFRHSLRDDDRIAFDEIAAKASKHVSSMTYSQRLNIFESILLSILIEQEKEIFRLKKNMEGKKDDRTYL